MGTKRAPTTAGNTAGLIRSWTRHLQAAHLSANTIANYRYAAEQFRAHLTEAGMPTDVGSITREHVEAYTSASSRQGPRLPPPRGTGV